MKKEKTPPVAFKAICEFISPLRALGRTPPVIAECAPLDTASQASLSFCSLKGRDAVSAIDDSSAGAILCRDDVPGIDAIAEKRCLLTVTNPRLAFIQCLDKFFRPAQEWGIHPSAIIEPDAVISKISYIGPGAYIGHHATVGEGTVMGSRVHVEAGSIIGQNVTLQTGAVIGCQGQGFERDETGILRKFSQTGHVVLEDDVEIGANSTVVRGTLSETRIGRGSKIGHLTDIGHNVRVGSHVFISAGVVVCGSAAIGDYSWLAPQCCIRNKVKIGERVTVGLGAVVTKDVPDDTTVIGVPAKAMQKKVKRSIL